MKILFVGRSVAHFSYYSNFLRLLVVNGHDLRILYDKKWSKNSSLKFIDQFLSENPTVKFEWLIRRNGILRDLIFYLRELRTYSSYLKRNTDSDFYKDRWLSYFPEVHKRLLSKKITQWILRSNFIYRVLDFLVLNFPPDKFILEYVKSISPQCIISSPMNMRFDEEVEYALAANKLKIPIYVIAYSWDNLTTKGLFASRFTKIFLWNDFQKNELVSIHKIENDTIDISGSMFFDKWRNSTHAKTKKDFLKLLEPNKVNNYLLYVGSSINIAKDETWFVDQILMEIKNSESKFISNLKVIVRPHPANYKIFEKYHSSNEVVVYPRVGKLPEDETDEIDFYNSIYHSAGVVGINTSAFLDAVLINKPIFSVLIDRYSNTQVNAQHFQNLIDTNVIYLCKDTKSMLDSVQSVNESNDYLSAARVKFSKKFVWPNEVSASEYVAQKYFPRRNE